MIAAAELLSLIADRRCFTLTIESGELWRVTISDAHKEMRGCGETFAEAWLTMEVVDLTSDIGEILHLASIWVDIHTAISEVEAKNLPPNQHPAANARA